MREKGELNHCEENKVQDFLWQENYIVCVKMAEEREMITIM